MPLNKILAAIGVALAVLSVVVAASFPLLAIGVILIGIAVLI